MRTSSSGRQAGNSPIAVAGIQASRAYLLAEEDQQLQIEPTADGLLVNLPKTAPDNIASVAVVEYQIRKEK